MENQNIHPVQADILVRLLFQSDARFSQLNELNISSDQFNFHLKKLTKEGLIEKTTDGKYRLTIEGKEFANRFDTEAGVIERQAKIGVLICGFRQKEGKKQYLLQQRLKQPYYGYWGFITGKVRWGESVFETAKRELIEETGLKATFEIKGVKHKTDYNKKGYLLEDKFFFVIAATNVNGKLKKEFEGGKNVWLSKKDILRTKELFGDVGQTLKIAEGNKIRFLETKFKVEKY